MTRMSTYARDLRMSLEARLQPVNGGLMDGVLIITARDITEAIAATEVPPVDENVAELVTPATVYLTARCHICGESGTVTVDMESKTTVDDKRRILAAKVDAGSVVHTCGQMSLPKKNVTPGQAEAWDIADLTGPTAPALDVDPLAELLGRVNVTVDAETVAGWNEPERRDAQRWAVAHHMARVNGEPDPERPAHVPEPHEPEEATETDAEAPDPTVCPSPGCIAIADHGGDHVVEGKPKRRRKPAADPREGSTEDAPEDGDLLPE